MGKIRADIALTRTGLVDSREKAKRLIMGGVVLNGTKRIDKPGELVDELDHLSIKGEVEKYVSRGGYKLERIINDYNLNLNGLICGDIGASTGGFTDCMLQNGAKMVYAIDVGYNQLSYKLRNDKRVISMERTNFRTFDTSTIEKCDFISIDVSFISLHLILPNAVKLLRDGGKIAALIKPQFEAGKEKVGKKGIVKSREVHIEVLEDIVNLSKELGLNISGLTSSPIRGTTGNIEFLILLEKSGEDIEFNVEEIVVDAHRGD